jgi:SAM-dependent methyltransferase
MNEDEYHLMADVEAEHWWYRGLRDLISRVAKAHRLRERHELRVLDAGCGTGENLRLLRSMLNPCYLGGFDVSPLALELCRRKVPDADVYASSLCNPELHASAYDLILSCDVLYMTGLDAARDGLRRLADGLRADGLLVFNLPAYNWLFSEHDLAIGTRERFTSSQVRRLLEELDLEVHRLTYRLFFLFPAVVGARLPSMLRGKPSGATARSDLARRHRLANGILSRILQWENAAIVRGIQFPWGSSVFAVGRRKGPNG